MNPKVYYFTQKLFKGAGMTWFHEIRCLRVLEGDPRLASLYKKYATLGNIYIVEYRPVISPIPYDLEWEMKLVQQQDYYLNRWSDKIILVDEKDQELK